MSAVRQETRHWDENDGRTHTLRTKEEADDYRYFPEPDLVPLAPDEAWIEQVRASLPPLPADRRARLAAAAGVAPDHRGRGHRGGAWTSTIWSSPPSPPAVTRPGCLIHVEHNLPPDGAGSGVGRRPRRADSARGRGRARRPPRPSRCWPTSSPPAATATPPRWPRRGASRPWIPARSRRPSTTPSRLKPRAWAKYVTGEDKAAGALVGAVMKATKGQADGKAVTALLQQRRASAAPD